MMLNPVTMHSRNTQAAAPTTCGRNRPSAPRLYTALLASVLGALLVMFCMSPVHAEEASKDHRQWWIDRYGLVEARSEPLAARAEEIFTRVAAAADKKGNRPPKLLVIGGKGDPYALTLKDGTIILTLASLRICYRDAAPETGDARLAFLIGHELAHLAKDDFWHSNAYTAVSSTAEGTDVRRALATQLEKTGGSLDFVKTQELQADSYGILSMTMAGYNPTAIIGPDGTNFFAYWDAQTGGTLAGSDALHNSPEARAEFVRTELRPVIDALPRFSQGVQLYRDGNFAVAATLFESFIERYPGREVYNDLGASQYQLALKSLAACSERSPAVRGPLLLDPHTTAQRLRQKPTGEREAAQYVQDQLYENNMLQADRFLEEMEAIGRAPCFQSEPYVTHLREAVRFFEAAEKKDATYLPARINSSTALILSGNYAKASSVAGEALLIDPNSPEAASNKAVAEYLFGRKNIAENPAALALLGVPRVRDAFALGLTMDLFNENAGPTLVWWPSKRAGLQASFGLGTFTTYALSGLVRFDKIAGLIPYAGLGYVSIARDMDVLGANERFTGNGGEIIAGAVLPLSARFALMADVHANSIKLDKTVTRNGQSVPVTMSYNPVYITATLMYYVF